MFSRFSASLLIRVGLCAIVLAIPASVFAQAPAYMSAVEGNVTLERAGETQPATINMPLVDGDRLRTSVGRVDISFPDGSAVEVAPYSEVEMLSLTRLRIVGGTIEHIAAAQSVPRAASAEYLPQDLQTYAPMLDRYGYWQYAAPYGYVWYPAVGAPWRPYGAGYWTSVSRYGWTWIGLDVWSWPTHHYGRWGYDRGAWFWIPG